MIVESLLLAIGVDPSKAVQGFNNLQKAANEADSKFNELSQRWVGVFKGIAAQIAAPVAGAFAVGKVINSYMSDIASVATMTGAYSQKLEEWRIKRAMLNRVTKEDIELYKKGREAIVGFRIAMADLSAKIMREAMPVMKFLIDGLNKFSAWCDRNGDNIVRFLKVAAGVLTAIFLPALLKVGAAMLANPLTWIILALGALIVVIDDLVVYMQGGKSALGGFWSQFGTGEEISNAIHTALEAVTAILRALWKPLAAVAAGFAAFKTAGVMVQGFVSVLASLRKAMLLVAANPLMVMFMALASAIMWVMDALDRAGGDWSKVVDIMGQDVVDFLNIFGGLGDTIVESFGFLIEPIKAIGQAFVNVFRLIVNTVKLFWAYLTGAGDESKDAIAGALGDAVSGILSALGNLLKSILDAVLVGLSALIDHLPDIAAGLLSLLGDALSALAGLLGKALEFLGSALDQLITYIAEKLGIAWAWDAIKEYAAALFDQISSVLSSLLSAVIDFAGAVPEFFAQAWQTATDFVSNAIAAIIGFFDGFSSSVSSVVSSTVDAVISWFESLGGSIGSIIDTAISTVTGIFNGFSSIVSNVLSSIQSAFTSIFGAIGAFVSGQWSVLGQSASEFVNSVISFVSTLPTTIAEIFAQFVSIVTNAFSSAWQAAVEFFTSIFDFLAAIPQKLLEAFDISGLIGKAKDAVSDMFGGAVDSVKNIFGFGDDDEQESSEDSSSTAQTDTQRAETGATSSPQQETAATPNSALPQDTLLAQTQEALAQQAVVQEQMPVNANSTAYTTNNNQRSSSNEVNNNITINAGAGTDPRELRRAVNQGLSDAGGGAAYVSTSDTGTMSI